MRLLRPVLGGGLDRQIEVIRRHVGAADERVDTRRQLRHDSRSAAVGFTTIKPFDFIASTLWASSARVLSRMRRAVSFVAAMIAGRTSAGILFHVFLSMTIPPMRSAQLTSVMFFAEVYHCMSAAICGVVQMALTSPVPSAVEISVAGSGIGWKPAPFHSSMYLSSPAQAKSFAVFSSSGERAGVLVKKCAQPASIHERTTNPLASNFASRAGVILSATQSASA